jgi:hypothetical protein
MIEICGCSILTVVVTGAINFTGWRGTVWVGFTFVVLLAITCTLIGSIVDRSRAGDRTLTVVDREQVGDTVEASAMPERSPDHRAMVFQDGMRLV